LGQLRASASVSKFGSSSSYFCSLVSCDVKIDVGVCLDDPLLLLIRRLGISLSRFLNFEEEGLTSLRCMEPGLDSGPLGIIVFGCRNHSSLPIVNCEVEGPIDVGTWTG